MDSIELNFKKKLQ